MLLKILLLLYGFEYSMGVRLSPLENNDKLEDIDNHYVVEWQWESWPIKQEPSEQDSISPGPRVNIALWKDSSKPAWYLFGGQPVDNESKKVYSDVWKYSVETRVWKRFFPAQSELKGTNVAKIGGMMTLRANLFDEGHSFSKKQRNYDIVLCGGATKTNTTNDKYQHIWTIYNRKIKLGTKKEEDEEPKSLAVYAPGTSKSNTVWQIDLKEKLWTAYVCCCDSGNNQPVNSTKPKIIKGFMKRKNETLNKSLKMKTINREKNESSIIDGKINKTEDEMDNEQHLSINNLKNKKKKINQSKKMNENSYKKIKIEKREEKKMEETQTSSPILKTTPVENSTVDLFTNHIKNHTKGDSNIKRKNHNETVEDSDKKKKSESLKVSKNDKKTTNKMEKTKNASKYCPDFTENGKPVTWCDSNNENLITTDISSSQNILWVFNLKTSHWTQETLTVSDDFEWPECLSTDPVRYAGSNEEVYIVCSPVELENYTSSNSSQNSKDFSENPSVCTLTSKAVFRINYKLRELHCLGQIELSSYFNSSEGQEVWRNDTKSVLQIIKTKKNETILLLAYLDNVDIWILNTDDQGNEYFDLTEKIWRGSAFKWFNKYNAPLYNFHIVGESGDAETVLIPNPRSIPPNDYWPRERGRFIIRVYRNENLKNQSCENGSQKPNLSYELMQVVLKTQNDEDDQAFHLHIIVFFCICLSVFTIFGCITFMRKFVDCPRKIRIRNECQKSPLVIRYSVIPDDLLYPLA